MVCWLFSYRSRSAPCLTSDDVESSVVEEEKESVEDDSQSAFLTEDSPPESRGRDHNEYERMTGEPPDIWKESQANSFRATHSWLTFINGKLGCTVCRRVGRLGPCKTQGNKMAHEWSSCSVTYNGQCRQRQLNSLRKKIHLHEKAASHVSAMDILRKSKNGQLESLILEQ